jgi:hypothetical protein
MSEFDNAYGLLEDQVRGVLDVLEVASGQCRLYPTDPVVQVREIALLARPI